MALVKFKSKKFLYLFVLPVMIFAIAFSLTMVQGVILYMWLGFFVAWGVHFYARFYYYWKAKES